MSIIVTMTEDYREEREVVFSITIALCDLSGGLHGRHL